MLPLAACSNASTPSSNDSLSSDLSAVENLPRYAQSTWGYSIIDQKTGNTLASQNDQKMFDPGSTMKAYSVAAALNLYGPGYRFTTPVYREGTLSAGTLSGNLVLVGAGDLSFGLREQPDGTLFYENLPQIDQSYASTGLGDAIEPPGNPLAALDELAGKVHAAGITTVSGNVVVDDRLFTSDPKFPDGLISPIWVNENLVDAEVTPNTEGQAASVSWRPVIASYSLQSKATTVSSSAQTSLTIDEPTPGTLVVSGQIAAGSAPRLVVHDVDDPSAFARTAFIEALQRAGVTVTATATGLNPSSLLPPKGSYSPSDLVAQHVSATLAQYANLIFKVSYNRGADLMTCLNAVKSGSTDCNQGLTAEVKNALALGVHQAGVFPFDGAGSDDAGRTTPAALTTFLRRVLDEPYGSAVFNGFPVVGRSGTMANVLPKSPLAGHAQIKTGNRVVGTPADQIIVLGNSLAGFIQTKSGRHVIVMIAVGNVPVATPSGVFDVTDDQTKMVEAVYNRL